MDDADGRHEGPIVTDAVLGGRLLLRQMRHGHRAGTDAVLLAAACHLASGDCFVDVGAGVGAVGLALALRVPGACGVLLEDDVETAALAASNCALNGVADRVKAVVADLFDRATWPAAGLKPEAATLVATNPPFFRAEAVRASGRARQARAHVLPPDRGHAEWLRSALALLAPHGAFRLIHRPEALPALLAGAEDRSGDIAVLPIYPREGDEATRILFGAPREAARRCGSPPACAARSCRSLHAGGRGSPSRGDAGPAVTDQGYRAGGAALRRGHRRVHLCRGRGRWRHRRKGIDAASLDAAPIGEPMEFLHTMIRVTDLDKTIAFFKLLDLVEVRRMDNEKGRYTLVFLAAPGDVERAKAEKSPLVELTYNWDAEDYTGGRNFGHLAYRVDDIYATCQRLMDAGVTINRPPRDGHMAFVRTPTTSRSSCSRSTAAAAGRTLGVDGRTPANGSSDDGDGGRP